MNELIKLLKDIFMLNQETTFIGLTRLNKSKENLKQSKKRTTKNTQKDIKISDLMRKVS